MAVTGTFTAAANAPKGTVFGNMRIVIGTVTMTSGAGDVTMPMKNIVYATVQNRASQAATEGVTYSASALTLASAASAAVFNVFAIGL